MTEEHSARDRGPTPASSGRFIPRTWRGKLAHVIFWVALCYVLTWGIATLCEWLSR